MSHVAADYQSKASNSVLPKGGRHTYAQPKAPSGQFDDLIKAIPDAPADRPARATAPADRAPPPETRAARRNDPAERGGRDVKDAKAPPADRRADDSRADDNRVAAANDAPADDAARTPAQAAGDTTPATDKTAQAAGDTTAAESETTGTTTATPDAVAALLPQAVVIDPATAVAAADPAVAGDKTDKTGTAKTETPTAATHPSIKAAEQQAAALVDQSTGLSADDADVLSALAAKAEQSVKAAQGDKTESKKTASTKSSPLPTSDGDAAASPGVAAPADGVDAKAAETKPVQSDLFKVAAEHQRGKSDTDAKPAEPAAQGINVGNVAPKTDGMPLQNFSTLLHQTHAPGASASAAGAATVTSDDKPVALSNVAVEITAKISAGKNSFDIRLDPEELGRIHVKVNVDRDGTITTHMMADRPDTLDLLRRDTQGLERALQDAGLKTSDNGMQFSLRDQAQQQQQNQQDGAAGRRLVADEDLTTTLTTTVVARDYGRYMQRPSGVDIRV